MSKMLDSAYLRRVADPHRIYSRTRTLRTTLIAIEGLIQKTCHSKCAGYFQFCREFVAHVLPKYEAFARHNAELIMFWHEAIEHFFLTGRNMPESGFRVTLSGRSRRILGEYPGAHPGNVPQLVLGTMACEKVVYQELDGTEDWSICEIPLSTEMIPAGFDVSQLYRACGRAATYRDEHPDQPAVTPQLVLLRPDGSFILPDGAMVAVASLGAPPLDSRVGASVEDMRETLRALLRDEMPALVEPLVRKVVAAHADRGHLADLVEVMTGAVSQLATLAGGSKDQTDLMKQMVNLTLPSHQLFLSASDYIELDGVAEALKRAPKLAEPSFDLDHCPDHGKASLWMKRLCRAERKKVAANAVAILVAEAKEEEPPPLYVPKYLMRKIEREHAKVLMFNPACWAKLKLTFLPPDTPTILFPNMQKDA
jgi:hypothetical protein